LHIYEADYPNDNRPRLAIQATRDYADGKIDDAARDAARAARAVRDARDARAAELEKQKTIIIKWLS
jgi:hypothetical protein